RCSPRSTVPRAWRASPAPARSIPLSWRKFRTKRSARRSAGESARSTLRTGYNKRAMSSVAEKRLTPEEYLRRERAAETKSEYYDGFVYAMFGASPRHNLIGAGLIRALGN